ncbi:MAG: pantoate--beta-alanine ligase [Candidatus Kapabacteria bacterium]|nr:pantoate--beta-alanine ligase [Candidatus Kapabacteria bacterium]
MNIIETIDAMQKVSRGASAQGLTIGCVPTMGYLHEGHASLIRHAARNHPMVVVSIFVNPTQFGPKEDFARYPRDLERDLEIVRSAGGTHVFAPSVEEMYPEGPRSSIHVSGVTDVLEGASRPTHFDGVATVVSRLFEAMLPDVAYFGQKDYQQTLVIRQMVGASPLADVARVRIETLPTMREEDGLARSSRNIYLSADDRRDAPIIYAALKAGSDLLEGGCRDLDRVEQTMHEVLGQVPRLSLDYAVAVDAVTLRRSEALSDGSTVALLIAARLGTTRLIDNLLVTLTRP